MKFIPKFGTIYKWIDKESNLTLEDFGFTIGEVMKAAGADLDEIKIKYL